MSKHIQKISGTILVALAVLLASLCVTLPASNPAFAADPSPSISGNATNGDKNSPYYGTKFVDPKKSLTVKNTVSLTGLTPHTEYTLSIAYTFYKDSTKIETLSGYKGTNFTTNEQGAASLDVSSLVTSPASSSRDYDTVRSIYIVSKIHEPVVYHDSPGTSELTTKNAPQPEISGTTATNASDGTKVLPYNSTVQVKDVVSYSNLYIGDTYKIRTVIVSKSTNGAEIVASNTSTFVPTDTSGETTVTTTFDTSGHHYDDEFVVYEYILDSNDNVLAKHEDIKDPSQTVRIEEERASVNVKAEWLNANGSKTDAPAGASATLQLLADGVDYGAPVTISAANGWSYTWTGLPKVSAKTGKDAVYTIKKIAFTAEGFETSEVTGDMTNGFVLTNKRVQETPASTVSDADTKNTVTDTKDAVTDTKNAVTDNLSTANTGAANIFASIILAGVAFIAAMVALAASRYTRKK